MNKDRRATLANLDLDASRAALEAAADAARAAWPEDAVGFGATLASLVARTEAALVPFFDEEDQIEGLKSAIEEVRNEEQEAYDNLPEAFQQGQRGSSMEEAMGYLDDATGSLDEAVSYAHEAREVLDGLAKAHEAAAPFDDEKIEEARTMLFDALGAAVDAVTEARDAVDNAQSV